MIKTQIATLAKLLIVIIAVQILAQIPQHLAANKDMPTAILDASANALDIALHEIKANFGPTG